MLNPGCNRRRRVTHIGGHMDARYRGGVLQSHRCRDCGKDCYCYTCHEVGPQPIQDHDGHIVHPELSLATQRLIAQP